MRDYSSNTENYSLKQWQIVKLILPSPWLPSLVDSLPSDVINLHSTHCFHTWKFLPGVIGFQFYRSGVRVRVGVHLSHRPWHHSPSIHGWEIKPHEFLMALGWNEQQRTKCLSIMHMQCRGSHFSSRWMRLPDLTLRFVENVKHFGVKHAWAQRMADTLLHWTSDALILQKNINKVRMRDIFCLHFRIGSINKGNIYIFVLIPRGVH